MVSTGLNTIQSLISAVVAQANLTTVVGLQDVAAPLGGGDVVQVTEINSCSVSGTSERTCSEEGMAAQKTIHLMLDASNCVVPGLNGGGEEFDGQVSLDANPFSVNSCSPLRFVSGAYQVGNPDAQGGAQSLDVTYLNDMKEQTLKVSALLSGDVTITSEDASDASCLVGSLNVTLQGGLTADLGGGASLEVTFFGTTAVMDMITYNADCVPVKDRLKLNGEAAFNLMLAPALVTTNGIFIPSLAVEFTNLLLTEDAMGAPVTTTLSGTINSDCWGGAVDVETTDPLTIPIGSFCPNTGQLNLTSLFASAATVTYDDGKVTVAQGGTMQTFPSCLSEELLTCIPQ